MQKFKGDALENKFIAAGVPTLDALLLQKDLFFAGAYESGPLGDLIYLNDRAPLSKAIKQDIFRLAFSEIFEAFIEAGSFESYLTVFRKIFGDSVSCLFTVPAPGKLTITLIAAELEFSALIMRTIESNAYIFDNLVDYEGNRIGVQTVKGFESQYELEQMLFELVPGGIFTTISLTFGGS